LVAWVARFKRLWEQLEPDHFEEIQKALFLILPGHQPRWIKGLAYVVYAYCLVYKSKLLSCCRHGRVPAKERVVAALQIV
jgi:hypothetical protein